ncbi:Arm DNA-binding domain-containing protein [Qipengyuania sp.]|uniref:Arm DNA-binding domain-containing protein n=1 Tax=Qipengyuania sp. TaxID=2004515 RepID=UPI0035C85DBC
MGVSTAGVADSRGLHLHISASGHKSWRYKHRFEKKEGLLTLGSFPEISLAEARERRDDAKMMLREGRDARHA